MTSKIRQVGLVTAGCQPWNNNMVSGCGPTFAYCATLAVYIYQYDSAYEEYKLTSINASHSKTILSLSWNMGNGDVFATGGADHLICVWDVKKRKCITKLENTQCYPRCICWIPDKKQSTSLAFSGQQGPIHIWDTISNSVTSLDATNGFDCHISLFKWHHTDPKKFVVGHSDGSLSLFLSGKRNKHCLRPSEESNTGDVDPVLAVLWDPLSSDYLLVSRKVSGMQLVDTNSLSVITEFMMPSKMISTKSLSWVDSAPGMFITGDQEAGVLRLWSVSHSSPLESIKLKATGFHCLHALDTMHSQPSQDLQKRTSNLEVSRNRLGSTASNQAYSVPPAHVVCTFADGGVGLYNLQHKKWNFLREQAHIETIFDCKFKPDNPKILATGSFDGTAKLWSVDDLTTIQTTNGNEGVIYSVSWAPADLNCLACGTRKRGVFIWDLNQGKVIRRFKEHGQHPVYCVAWNQRDSHRLASCSSDGYCVVRRMDGEELKRFQHPDEAVGCDWSIVDKDLLATGCQDGIVRVWNMLAKNNSHYRALKGHTSRVFHVRWHPLIRNLLASGSDDTTIRVWEVESETCYALLEGHTSSVRGLCWNHEIAYLLTSGSWDSTLRLWDVRDKKCIETVDDHGADVYGLTTHPNNPFTIATSSRDSTVRIWSLGGVTESLFLRVLAGEPVDSIVTTPDDNMKPGSALKLSGNMSRHITSLLREKKNSDFVKLRWFSELFCSSRGLENLWDLVCTCRGQRESTLSQSYRKGILHTKHLTKYKAAEAQECEREVAQHKPGLRHKERSLMRSADLHLKLGNIRRHCEILVELGDWERAISLAPGVSISFWASLTEKYATVLESERDKDATAFHIASGKVREAVRFITSQGDLQDALIVAQSAQEGNTPHVTATEEIHNGDVTSEHESYDDLVSECCDHLSSRYFHKSSPYSAASVHLANDDFHSAIDCLIRSNELALALCLSKNLKGSSNRSVIPARLLARKLESLKMPDIAIKLLKTFDPPVPKSDWSAIHDVCARCDVTDPDTKTRLHQAAGLPSPSECKDRAVSHQSNGDLSDAMRYHVLSGESQTGLELAIQLFTARFKEDANWTVDAVMLDLAASFAVRTSVLKQQKNKTLRTKLLAIAAYFGALLAVRRQYDSIVKPLFVHAKSLVQLSQSFDPHFPLSPSNVHEELQAWLDKSDNDVATRLRHRAGEETHPSMTGITVVDSSDFPSHSNTAMSTISGKKISGAPFILDDGRSVLSINEAIMWAKVNQFSPTSSGERICPF
uniref:WD repeat-containing protein 17 n=1 Tax=Phallusia mammillata TaxID=59560 RepID=A0A6F9DXU0_9ASCI|nr:WD repeat-containing protein 17 [Phallusia mammillata]